MNKILLVNYGFYPARKYGGPVNSIQNFCDLMGGKYACYLITCDHEIDSQDRLAGIHDGWNKRDNCNVLYLPDCKINYKNIKSVIESLRPDLIYIQSFFEYKFVVPILLFNKTQKIPVIIAPRGDLCEGAMRKKYKKLPYIYGLNALGLLEQVKFHSTSEDETTAIKKYLRKNTGIYQIENIPSRIKAVTETGRKAKGQLNVIYVSRIVPKKNLLQAIRIVKKAGDDICFDIYGPIEDKDYWDQCTKEIGTRKNIRYCGMLDHEDVYREFRKHDLFFFPTFSENYGHVIVEAMQCGCPVLISDQTPWNHVNQYQAGAAFSLQDEEAFVRQLQYYLSLNCEEFDSIRKRTAEFINGHLDFSRLEKEYTQMIESEMIGNTSPID